MDTREFTCSSKSDISKERLLRDLREMGIKNGDHVSVALSLKSIGNVIGGPATFIEAILEAVGNDGTVMMNTHTRDWPLSEIPNLKEIFDYQQTPTVNGIVPETFRKRKGVIRSQHPVYSIAAYGKLATYLTENHNQESRNFLPYSLLAKKGGKSLFIGLGNRLVAIRHEAQYLAGLFNTIKIRRATKYINKKGKTAIFSYYCNPCVSNLSKMVPVLRQKQIIKIGKIGMARSIIGSTNEILSSMADLIKENPSINLCDKIYCLWCREFERQKDLYKQIEFPRNFQKNPILKKTIQLINKYRIKYANFSTSPIPETQKPENIIEIS